MRIRTIQMISNTYEYLIKDSQTVSGKYCVFGPFDAMNIEDSTRQWDAQENRRDIRDYTRGMTLSHCDGKSNRNDIICVFPEPEEKEEQEFIDKMNMAPYLFLSFLLLDHGDQSGSEKIKSELNNINNLGDCRAYLTFGKNEIILLHYCNSYTKGMRKMLHNHTYFSLSKASTIFSVREDALDIQTSFHKQVDYEEMVSCRFRGVMKNTGDSEKYIWKLKKNIQNDLKNSDDFRWYDVIGGTDKLIEIDNYPLEKLLPLYKKGNLLTHSNKDYFQAWYNIETEIMVKK